jgi:aspartyl protease family protein
MIPASGELPRTLKFLIVWLVAGTAVFLAITAWQAQAARARFSYDAGSGVVELKRARDGHFHWPGTVNGLAVEFLVDTGATGTAIPQALADRLGLAALGPLESSTAGGVTHGSWTRVDLVLEGGPRIERLRVAVLPRLQTPLLGMDVLSRLRFTQSDGSLRLQRGGS